ncbi:MAG: hypothetical protein A3F14_05785 [Gammaproteobacteria bacterium RIFCSPHIGHO2_12_FULL_43_28]|nr:MAG: hypothetical protein A3F14_05785 [Gammaproteobacteria bacterium RIFCSPHIGHO2_12_FULL_43_28]
MELCHASVFLAGIQAFLRFILGASKKHAGMTQFDECSQKMDHFVAKGASRNDGVCTMGEASFGQTPGLMRKFAIFTRLLKWRNLI